LYRATPTREPCDLGRSSAVLDEKQDDVDRAKETVASSFDLVVLLLDVRRVSTDDVNLFADALDGLRDRLPQSSPVLDRLREDVGNFSDHVEQSSDVVEQSRDDVEQSRDVVEQSRDDVEQSRDDVEQSSDVVEKSSHYVKESSERRSRPKSSSSGPREARIRLLHRRQEGRAHVEQHRASSSGLKSVVS
jgi:methyl-accepting chemotaxis protein